jgi:hypothetical protein
MATRIRPHTLTKLKSSQLQHSPLSTSSSSVVHEPHASAVPKPELARPPFKVHSPQISRKVTSFGDATSDRETPLLLRSRALRSSGGRFGVFWLLWSCLRPILPKPRCKA